MGFLWTPAFRLTPQNGPVQVIPLNSTTLADAKRPVSTELIDEPDRDERVDVQREARSALFGIRRSVRFTLEIATMLNQAWIAQIVDALLDPRWTVELTLNYTATAPTWREVEYTEYTIESVADKWFAAHRIRLGVRCRALLTEVPRVTTVDAQGHSAVW